MSTNFGRRSQIRETRITGFIAPGTERDCDLPDVVQSRARPADHCGLQVPRLPSSWATRHGVARVPQQNSWWRRGVSWVAV